MELLNNLYDCLSWCDLITVHGIPGDGILDGIRSAALQGGNDIGCFLVAEMSSKGALTNREYKKSCGEMALGNEDIVAGFVSQSLVIEDMPGFIHCTPGVKLQKGTDGLGQQYRSVEELKKSGFVDVFIVGRGIIEAEFPEKEAALYRDAMFYQ